MRLTESLCNECYQVVPATISEINGAMWMEKRCPSHELFHGMVERDSFWYYLCNRLNCKNIYDGYLIDITNKCNIKCKYCYNKNDGSQMDVESVLKDAAENRNLAPFIMMGGEPTLHEGLPEILSNLTKMAETFVITNGIRLCDESYLNEICASGLLKGNKLNVGLSFHPESDGKDIEFLELCRKRKVIIDTALYVIDSIDHIDIATSLARKYSDVIPNMRIKAASNLGNESGATNKIFVSDMINHLKRKGNTDLALSQFNKLSFGNVIHEGLFLMLVSWYDINNVDLLDISCPPYYRSKDGGIYNLVTAELINEGIKKGKIQRVTGGKK
jgi:organic radical activating enzyme